MRRSWAQIHLAAAAEAARTHRELDIDTSRPIDPFEALERAGVVVIRRRLDRLAGIYVAGKPTEGIPDGVLINVAHPLSKQRYTAAHELAHHRRDKDALVVIDEETEWKAAARGSKVVSDRERFAETFAAWFLIPKRLVQATMERLELRAENLDGQGAYALALKLGTSYAATVWHLADVGIISTSHRDRLLKLAPQSIKRDLGAIDVAADSWKDVWVVRPSQRPERITPIEGDVLVFDVPEIPSSGYRWQPPAIPTWLDLVRDEYHVPDGEFLGGKGQHRFVFRVDGTGHEPIRLEMGRPWSPDEVADSFEVDIVAQPQSQAGMVQPSLLVAASA